MALWEHGWKYLFDALELLSDADLMRTVTIRTEPHSVMQAINRQVAHYSYHVGQITYLAKHFAAEVRQVVRAHHPSQKIRRFQCQSCLRPRFPAVARLQAAPCNAKVLIEDSKAFCARPLGRKSYCVN